MNPIDELAERKIQEALAQGAFDDLPGAGKPLPEEDLALVPEHLRAGYRLLKNAGFLPPELESLKELRDTAALIERIGDPDRRQRELARLRLLELRLRAGRGHGLASRVRLEYQEKLFTLFAGD
jgi:hypothetical protein